MKVIDLGLAKIALTVVNHDVHTTRGIWIGERIGAKHAGLNKIAGISTSSGRGPARYTKCTTNLGAASAWSSFNADLPNRN